MLPAAFRRLPHHRLKIMVMCVIIGASIGAPIALAFFATTPRLLPRVAVERAGIWGQLN
jgi:hypothetical protein